MRTSSAAAALAATATSTSTDSETAPPVVAVASGIPTADVADAVHDAVVAGDFWILTHDETKPAITERARQIVDGINPPLAGFV